MSSVMLDVIDKMTWYLGISFWNRCALSEVLKCLILKELFDFEFLSILPFRVPIFLVNFNRLVVISWYLVTILVDGLCSVDLQSCLVDHPR